MTKGKLKLSKKEGTILLLVTVVLFFIIFIGVFFGFKIPDSKKGDACQYTSQCPDREETYCTTNYSECTFVTTYNCSFENVCSPINCSKHCQYCDYGCTDGKCRSFINKSDLIVNSTKSSTQDGITVIDVSIKNIGVKVAPESTTIIRLGSTVLFSIETPSLLPGEIKILSPVVHTQAPGTSSTFKVIADAYNEVDELNEDNNEYFFIIAI